MSAPATPSLTLPAGGPGTRSAAREFEERKRQEKKAPPTPLPSTEATETDFTAALLECYRSVHDGYSLDRVLADPALVAALHERCVDRGLSGTPRDWSRRLFQLRKAGRLADLVTTKRTELTWADCDPFLAAIEFAWRRMLDAGAASLDYILADPVMATRFDAWAAAAAPGGTPLVYRWGALKLRKDAYVARSRAQRFDEAPPPVEEWREIDPTRPIDAAQAGNEGSAGLYAIPDRSMRGKRCTLVRLRTSRLGWRGNCGGSQASRRWG